MFGASTSSVRPRRASTMARQRSHDQPDLTTAGAHPYLNIGFTLGDDTCTRTNLEDLAEFVIHTAPGEYGNARAVPHCPELPVPRSTPAPPTPRSAGSAIAPTLNGGPRQRSARLDLQPRSRSDRSPAGSAPTSTRRTRPRPRSSACATTATSASTRSPPTSQPRSTTVPSSPGTGRWCRHRSPW